MKITFSRQALTDIDDILHYITLRNPSAADRVHAVIERTIRRIAAHPHPARQVTDETVLRRMPLVRLPYLIYYEVGKEDVTILRILAALGGSLGNVTTNFGCLAPQQSKFR